MISTESAITVENLYKTFKLPHEQSSGIKQTIVNALKRKKGYEVQKVLKNVSFDIKKGEFFGIVGRNGSGKSTLLKILAGIYVPDSGSVVIDGSLTPFIELGVGFNMELTGRENVFLNGALLGFSKKEMTSMYQDIVDFAELERFMDQKLKNYSSGMQVRLAFSIAIRAKSDILIMDEVLAVGDASFQKKCLDVFRELKEEGKTIILVTHDMGSVERFCDRVLIVDKGGTEGIYTPQEASGIYARLNIEDQEKASNGAPKKAKKVERWGAGGVTVKKISFYNNDKKTKIYNFGDTLTIEIEISRDEAHKETEIVCGLAVFDENGANIIGPNSQKQKIKTGANLIKVDVPNMVFAPGEYKLTTAIFDEKMTEPFDYLDRTEKFNIIADHTVHGMLEIDSNWNSQ